MKKNLFPKISNIYKVSWQQSFAVIMNVKTGDLEEIDFIESILLNLCNGHYSIYELDIIFTKYYSHIKEFNELLKKISKFLVFNKFRKSNIEIFGNISKLKNGITNPNSKSYHFPIHVVIHLLESCNLNCIYCIRNKPKTKKHLSKKIVMKLLEEISRNGGLKVTFTGGEPLLDTNLIDYIKYCIVNDIYPSFSTNGVMLKKEISKELKIIGLNSIQISLDTLKEDNFLKINKGFNIQQVKENIKDAIKEGLEVTLRIVVIKDNANEVDSILTFAKQVGIKNIDITPAISYINSNNRYCSINKTEKEILLKTISCEKDLQVNYSEVNKKWKTHKDIIRCGGLVSDAIIFPNAKIGFCANLPTYTYGNVKVNSIEKAWKSERFKSLKNKFFSKNINTTCRNCDYYNFCFAGCPALKLGNSLSIDDVDPRCFIGG